MAYLLCSIIMLLCCACGGSESSEGPVVDNQPTLQITVFTTGHPVVSRGDVGDVDGSAKENYIHKLQVWVFEHNDGTKVAYLEDATPMSQLHSNTDGDILEGTYQLVVSNSFADAKPNVDVYVLANGNQVGFPQLDGNTSRAVLKEALMNDTYGLTTLVTDVPVGIGLPMSGMLNDAELGGQSPVLNVKTPVTVVRTVSKMRFIFSRNKRTEEDNSLIFITKIELEGRMIPTQEYIFLENAYKPRAFRVGDSYVEEAKVLATPGDVLIAECETPSKYAYIASQSGQEYEEQINMGINGIGDDPDKKELTQLGLFYFRESDKQMKGTIYYKKNDETKEKSASFVMNAAGDFSRNHTWIVYGYFAGSDNLQVITLKINPWTDRGEDNHEVYNW